MNKWKIAFWVVLVMLILSVYLQISQAFAMVDRSLRYSATQQDLNTLGYIINETDLSKQQIQKAVKINYNSSVNKDTTVLNTISLIFIDNKLTGVINK